MAIGNGVANAIMRVAEMPLGEGGNLPPRRARGNLDALFARLKCFLDLLADEVGKQVIKGDILRLNAWRQRS